MAHKTPQEALTNYERRINDVPQLYEEGIDRTTNWKSNATSTQAEQNYKEALNKAISEGRRIKGLQKVSEEEWKQMSKDKGAANIAKGMELSKTKYLENVTPTMNAAISAIDSAPAKTNDYKANVNNRLMKVIEAQKKAAGKL